MVREDTPRSRGGHTSLEQSQHSVHRSRNSSGSASWALLYLSLASQGTQWAFVLGVASSQFQPWASDCYGGDLDRSFPKPSSLEAQGTFTVTLGPLMMSHVRARVGQCKASVSKVWGLFVKCSSGSKLRAMAQEGGRGFQEGSYSAKGSPQSEAPATDTVSSGVLANCGRLSPPDPEHTTFHRAGVNCSMNVKIVQHHSAFYSIVVVFLLSNKLE